MNYPDNLFWCKHIWENCTIMKHVTYQNVNTVNFKKKKKKKMNFDHWSNLLIYSSLTLGLMGNRRYLNWLELNSRGLEMRYLSKYEGFKNKRDTYFFTHRIKTNYFMTKHVVNHKMVPILANLCCLETNLVSKRRKKNYLMLIQLAWS